jgi:MFS transporter, DHA1 family, inner membrane transport protein
VFSQMTDDNAVTVLGGIDRRAFLLALGTFAIGTDAFIIAGVLIANFGLYTFIAAILRRSLPATAVPFLLLLFGLGAVAGNFIGGVLSDRFGTQRPTITCLTLLICALAGIEFTSSSLIAVGANMIGWALLMAALFTLQQQRAILVDPAQSNLLLALNNSVLYLGPPLARPPLV